MSGVTSAKPYGIAKRTVWEAYQQVKANRGAAGVDDETIADFERDLSKNLYKLWNRMSSGSYFPPPVKQVEIPKASSGTRKLGVPTVSDRMRKPSSSFSSSQSWTRSSIRTLMGIGRGGRRSKPWRSLVNAAGGMTGSWSLISRQPWIALHNAPRFMTTG
jgi:hypothetical protein